MCVEVTIGDFRSKGKHKSRKRKVSSSEQESNADEEGTYNLLCSVLYLYVDDMFCLDDDNEPVWVEKKISKFVVTKT